MADSFQTLQTEIATAAHNLREPLRTIRCYVDLLAEEPDQSVLCIDRIRQGTERLEALIHGIFECLQMPESFRPQRVAMNLVQLNAVSRLPEADRRCVTSDDLPSVMGDFEILTEVFNRLIDNALTFRRGEPAHLHISASPEPSSTAWRFAFEDQGIGVKEADWERCFGLFQRLHAREMPGEGIGLTYCRRAIELHGGRIWMESAPGSGTKIFFTLPAL